MRQISNEIGNTFMFVRDVSFNFDISLKNKLTTYSVLKRYKLTPTAYDSGCRIFGLSHLHLSNETVPWKFTFFVKILTLASSKEINLFFNVKGVFFYRIKWFLEVVTF